MKQRRQNRKDDNQALLCVVSIKICTNRAFLCIFQPFLLCSFVLISVMSKPLRTWILSVRSSLFGLFLIERHHSQNEGSLKSEERLSDFKERSQLWCTYSMFGYDHVHAHPVVFGLKNFTLYYLD